MYEIRSFYLNGTFSSMAIFSATNMKTAIDMRSYDLENPNRKVPYKLPLEIEKKLNSLMLEEKLNTGSIDLIKGLDGSYYFLEINPIGQFGSVSQTCNYYLEKKIAKYLV